MYATRTDKLCADTPVEHDPVNKTPCQSAFGHLDPSLALYCYLPEPDNLSRRYACNTIPITRRADKPTT